MKLFLDDLRNPIDCAKYMHMRIGPENSIYLAEDWYIVRNYPEFVKAIDQYKGQITHISYDHDLADGHYHKNMQEGKINYSSHDFLSDDFNKTGWHCAQYMKMTYDNLSLPYPRTLVHSLNPVGTENIMGLLNLFK